MARDVRSGKIKFGRLSPIGEWSDGGDEPIPFRIAPALCACGLMSSADVALTFHAADPDLAFDHDDVAAMIAQDRWMVY